MSPSRGGQPSVLSLHNTLSSPHAFSFDIVGTQIEGTLTIQPDEVVNVFTADPGQTYTVKVSVDEQQESEYEWSVEDGRESLTAEWTEDGLVFKGMRLM